MAVGRDDGTDQRAQVSGQELFLCHLTTIEAVISFVCRRHYLPIAEAEDFSSYVKLKLIDDDYRILSDFQGRSSLATYVAAVVNNMLLNYRDQLWGKWRPSVQARRLGPVAVRLEVLLQRDGLSVDEAIQTLQTNHGVAEDHEDLFAMARSLPHRSKRVSVDLEAAADLPDPTALRDVMTFPDEGARLRRKMDEALRRALASLSPEDRLMLRMRFQDGFSVADIARARRLNQKRLYHRMDRIFDRLRRHMEGEGVGAAEVSEILAARDWDSSIGLDEATAVVAPDTSRTIP